MPNISAAWLHPRILVAGAFQAWGPPMNGLDGIALIAMF